MYGLSVKFTCWIANAFYYSLALVRKVSYNWHKYHRLKNNLSLREVQYRFAMSRIAGRNIIDC
jgi:hypothetical protein